MKLYLLKRELTGYDEIDTFVIAAYSIHQARAIAARLSANEGPDAWLQCKNVTFLAHVNTIKSTGVVCKSFNADAGVNVYVVGN